MLILLCRLPAKLLSSVREQKHDIRVTFTRYAVSLSELTSALLFRISDALELEYLPIIVFIIVSKYVNPPRAIKSTSQRSFSSESQSSTEARIPTISRSGSLPSSIA